MRSIQTQFTFPLSSVKPLERLSQYRAYCLEATRNVCRKGVHRRELSPASGAKLEAAGEIAGLPYSRCPATGSLFLSELPDPAEWATLLSHVCGYRRSPEGFHRELAQSRAENVYVPKLEWIQQTLQLQGLSRPKVLEAATPPSDLAPLLLQSGLFSDVESADEMDLAHSANARETNGLGSVEAAVLLESLDRVDDPVALLNAVEGRLAPGGLLFVTALVCSGFDAEALGWKNLYLYPPDRTNFFSLGGLRLLLERAGFSLIEVSTPGVLDLEIFEAHLRMDPDLSLSPFEKRILESDPETRRAFQSFLQERGLSSFARIVAKKPKGASR